MLKSSLCKTKSGKKTNPPFLNAKKRYNFPMKIIIGTIKEITDRECTVTLPNQDEMTTVRLNPLNLDEREQKPNIKIGTECITLFDERRGVGYTCFSLSQGIALSKEIARLEQDEVQIYGDKIKLMGASGDNKDTQEKESTSITMRAKKYEIKSESEELIGTLVDLVSEIMAIKVTCMAMHPLAPLEPLDGGTVGKLGVIKSRLESFK
jgi:hypothetical protein